jgi:uncharacterized RDD family membrane protein YckC
VVYSEWFSFAGVREGRSRSGDVVWLTVAVTAILHRVESVTHAKIQNESIYA